MRLRENLVEFDETLIDALKDAAARKMVDLFFWKVEDGFYVSAQSLTPSPRCSIFFEKTPLRERDAACAADSLTASISR